MKIVIAMPIWKRHDLTRLIMNYYYRMSVFRDGYLTREQRKTEGIYLLACGSEGDASKALAESSGWNYVECPNEPFSQKINFMFEACQRFTPDAVIAPGSDDLLGEPVIRYYDQHYSKDADYILGLKDFLFYSIPTGQCIFFDGWPALNPVKTMGPSRIYSKKVLDKMKWRPCGDDKVHRGIDTSISLRMKKFGITEMAIKMEVTGGIACDFKQKDHQLTPFERLLGQMHGTHPGQLCDKFLLESVWPKEMEMIKALNK